MSMRKMHRLISRLKANARNKWSIWMRPASSCCFSDGDLPMNKVQLYRAMAELFRSRSHD